MIFPYKLVAFDLDGTLTKSKQPITEETASLLTELSRYVKIVIISGGSFVRFQEQLLRSLEPSVNIILLPTEGSERFEYDMEKREWKMTGHETFPDKLKKEVVHALNEIIESAGYDIPREHYGEYIEDRDTEIAFAALGQDAPLEKKEAWDPTREKRMKIKEALEAKVKGIMVAVAGTTSLDILPAGFDKAKGLHLLSEKLGIAKEDIVFIGDAIVPGGNDYSVFKSGIKSIVVRDPEDTQNTISSFLSQTRSENLNFPQNPIAYFCAEYAFDGNVSMYAGGLGILAGDYVLEAALKNLPFVAIGLKYGESVPDGFSILNGVYVTIPLQKRKISAQVWHKAFSSNVHVFLLDTNITDNPEDDMKITHHLYDPDFHTRIYQQMVLGIGGIRLLSKLNISPKIYHLNEGHTAFAGIAIIAERKEDLDKVVITKHTVLSEAGILIPHEDFNNIVDSYAKETGLSVKDVFERGKFELNTEQFSTTKLIISCATRKNAVSRLHAVFEKQKHPHSNLISITNGVHRPRWQDKELLHRSKNMSDAELWKIKRRLRIELIEYVRSVSGKSFNPDVCTLVWARRFAAYKRPNLLFSDMRRLTEIISNPSRPIQCIISGKAHPGDAEGNAIVQKIIAFSNTREAQGRIVYLPDYSVKSAEKLVRGADIWLNTPELGKEACGTSGMKACLNGALQCTIRDGWVDEVSWEGRGWILPGDVPTEATAQVLYDLLAEEISPCFYEDSPDGVTELPHKWIARMRSTMEIVEKDFTAERMLRDYNEKLYLLS